MLANLIFGSLASLSFGLLLWQWFAGRGFPLHRRAAMPAFAPGVTLLKPLKGVDAATADCLRSWFQQEYSGAVQMLFAVATADDPAAEIVRGLLREFPDRDAQLVVCSEPLGANAKVSKLAQLQKLARHEVWIISDADVRVPPDFLANAVALLRDPGVGLVNCFYRLANPSTLAMRWEAVAINADFWSQVLQSRSLKPLDFALGAVMIARRGLVEAIGGFKALADCLADDYQLGNRIARRGQRIELCPVVVECWDPPMSWAAVWKHQLRWARTIRVCQPAPYFFSILSNVTLWALVWCGATAAAVSLRGGQAGSPGAGSVVLPETIMWAAMFCVVRMGAAFDLQRRLTRSSAHAMFFWLTPIKDLLQALIWLAAFAGDRVEWRGRRFKLRRDGTLQPLK